MKMVVVGGSGLFTTSTHNLLTAEVSASVQHRVAVLVVGTGRLLGSGYLRAKFAQEKLIRDSSGPLHDRPGHAVLRVLEEHRRCCYARQRRSSAARTYPAHATEPIVEPGSVEFCFIAGDE